jgi:hypothetical protein
MKASPFRYTNLTKSPEDVILFLMRLVSIKPCILSALFLTITQVSAQTMLPSDSASGDTLEMPDEISDGRPAAATSPATQKNPQDTAAAGIKPDTAKGLGALAVPPVISPALSNGCIACTMISPYDPECATNFLIGKNYMLPAGKLLTYASNRLWFVKKSLGNGDIGLAGGPSLETNALYPSNFISDDLSRWKRRITDSLDIPATYYYYPYGGGG